MSDLILTHDQLQAVRDMAEKMFVRNTNEPYAYTWLYPTPAKLEAAVAEVESGTIATGQVVSDPFQGDCEDMAILCRALIRRISEAAFQRTRLVTCWNGPDKTTAEYHCILEYEDYIFDVNNPNVSKVETINYTWHQISQRGVGDVWFYVKAA